MKYVQTGSANKYFQLDQVGIEVNHPNVLYNESAYRSSLITKAYVLCFACKASSSAFVCWRGLLTHAESHL